MSGRQHRRGVAIYFPPFTASDLQPDPAGQETFSPSLETGFCRCLPDRAPLTTLETPAAQFWCSGEMFSYITDGTTSECLACIATDWQDGRLDYQRLNGRFLLLIWDKAAQQWQVITDRVGAMHCYAVMRGDRITLLGSDLPTLAALADPLSLDWQALSAFFTLGIFLGTQTYYKGIEILQPASIYRISAGGDILSHTCYFEWHHTIDAQRTYAQTLQQYDALLRQAVRRRVGDGQAILPLSGGLDSRSLAAVLPAASETPTYAYGYSPDSVETRIAAQVAAVQGLSFHAHTITPYLFDRLKEITLTLHGSQDVTMARQASVNAWVAEQAQAVLTGLWGDVWCDQMGVADGLPQGVTLEEHTLHKMQKRGSDWLLRHLCDRHIPAQASREYITNTITQGLSSLSHITDPDFRVKVFKTSQWAFRWSNASLRGFEAGGQPRIPYYDVDLVDFFCTVPTTSVRDRRLQIAHLKHFAPRLARIRWQKAEANLYLAPYGYWLSLPRRALQKTRRLLTGQRVVERNWEVQLLGAGGPEGLEDWLLRPGLQLHALLPPLEITALLDTFHTQPDAAAGYTVSMLLTFSAWLEAIHELR